MDTDYRMDDQRKTAEMEMNIDEYKVEPTANQCMTDFYTFEHPTVDDIPAEVCGAGDGSGDASRAGNRRRSG